MKLLTVQLFPISRRFLSLTSSSVSIVTKLWGAGAVKGFFSLGTRPHTGSGAHPSSYSTDTGGFFRLAVKLTTHHHIVPRLRMRGAIPPLFQYVFTSWDLIKHRDKFIFYFKYIYSPDHPIFKPPQSLFSFKNPINKHWPNSDVCKIYGYQCIWHYFMCPTWCGSR